MSERKKKRAAYSLSPQIIDGNLWYYEGTKGLVVIARYESANPCNPYAAANKTVTRVIPWRLLEATMRRRRAVVAARKKRKAVKK